MIKQKLSNKGPVLLCILDGWGEAPKSETNAISKAYTPNYDRLYNNYPHSKITTFGSTVGLPNGQMGNSEVGHMTIGSGRIILQDLPRINKAITTKEINNNPIIKKLSSKKTCHVMGLLSDGGVHSDLQHIIAICKILAKNNVTVKLHAFLDGRDTPPQSATKYIKTFQNSLDNYKNVEIATIMGRYFAMDRDNRWDRTEQAFKAIIEGQGEITNNFTNQIENFYKEQITDEFIPPSVITGYQGVNKDDAMIMVNFRADRVRQILTSLLDKDFTNFIRPYFPIFNYAVGMTHYSDSLTKYIDTIFLPIEITNTISELISNNKLKQLHIAETEKYAHVTYFFNGGREQTLPGEQHILIPSPKVATYDLKPEMSAREITDKLTRTIKENSYDFIVVNYANADMVGHTGKMEPTIKAIEVLDESIGQLMQVISENDGIMLVTADHGNAEQMYDHSNSSAHTAHTSNLVPLILFGNNLNIELKDGGLADIAPTIIDIMNIDKPAEMTGKSLIIRK